MISVEQIKTHIKIALGSYESDNADSDFQRGHLSAIIWMAELLEISVPKEVELQCTRAPK